MGGACWLHAMGKDKVATRPRIAKEYADVVRNITSSLMIFEFSLGAYST
jgi:hypothetical protein